MEDELDTSRKTLFRAVELAGGVDALADILGTNRLQVLGWVSGMKPAPQEVFLKCVDFVLAAESSKQASK